MRPTTLLAARAADFCRANHASRRDLPRENFWTAIRALPDQVARALVTSRLTAGLAVAAPGVASATTYTVTTTDDSVTGSLRDALAQANSNPGPDTVAFDASLSGQTITLIDGQLLIKDSVTIQGPGSAHLTIDGNRLFGDGGAGDRIFYMYGPSTSADGGTAPPLDITISGLTLQNGRSQDHGGAIWEYGDNLTLSDVVVRSNVTGASGGGLAVSGATNGTLTIRDSTFSGNQASRGGGTYIRQVATATVDHVAVTDNVAAYASGGFYIGQSGTVTIQSSTISGNSTPGWAGGVQAYQTTSMLILDSTISANAAGWAGGGLFFHNMGTVGIANATVTGNSATGPVDGGGGPSRLPSGGGVWLYGGLPATISNSTISGNTASGSGAGIQAIDMDPVAITNTIVAGNTGGSPGDIGADGSAVSAAFCLIENPGGAIFVDSDGGPTDGGGVGNIVGVDPLLGALADNGGDTQTMLPGSGSPVINAGDPAFTTDAGPSLDQRGQPRISGGRIDMGAVERQPGDVVDAGGSSTDAGSSSDAGDDTDAGASGDQRHYGCTCNGADADVALALLAPLGALLLRRRRSRT